MPEKARLRRKAFAEFDSDENYAWLRTQSGRRRLIVLHVLWGAGGYLGLGIATVTPYGWLSGILGQTATVTLAVVLTIGWLFGFVLFTGWLNASISGLTELPYQVLDEAQTAMRREAESFVHRITRRLLFVVGLAGASTMGLLFAAREDRPDTFTFTFNPDTVHLVSVWSVTAVIAATSLLALLSTYLVAWRLPDNLSETPDNEV